MSLLLGLTLLLPLSSCSSSDDDDGGGGGTNNANLSGLAVSAGSLVPVFAPNTTSYTVLTGSATTTTTVTAVTSGSGATMTINGAAAQSGVPFGPINLATGANVISILVTAPDAVTTKTYDVSVTRQALSSQLSNLSLTAGSLIPAFAPATTSYTVTTLSSTTSTTVTATLADFSGTMTINGTPATSGQASPPIALNVGANVITVVGTATDTTTTTYTVTVDVPAAPTISQEAYIKASNTAANDGFGAGIGISGDTLAVGAHLEDSGSAGINGNQADDTVIGAGAAYVFTRSGSVWSQQAYIKASNPGTLDAFGNSLAVDGDTLVVGASNEASNATGIGGNQADNSAPGAGAVYVFTRSGTVWSQHAYIKASNTAASSQFGINVALDGDTLVVGATGESSNATGIGGNQSDTSAPNAGAVYVFVRNAGVWTQQAYIKASNTQANDFFGTRVTISVDTLAVSAPAEASNATGIGGNQAYNSAANSGAVYVFTRSGTAWSQQAYIKASNSQTNDGFGSSLAISNNTLAVGAVLEASSATGVNGNQADNSALGAGATYVFTRSGTTWSQQAYIKASNTGIGDNFGNSLSLDLDLLVVGAAAESSAATGINGDQASNAASSAGAAYVFARTGTVWSQTFYVKASNTEADDDFGTTIALAGSTFASAATGEDSNATGVDGNQADNSASSSGAVYVFD